MSSMDIPVYVLYIDSENSLSVYLDDERYDDFYEKNFRGHKMANGWRPPPFQIEDEDKPLKDFVAGTSMAPLLSDKAKDALAGLINNYVEFLPCMEIYDNPYYLLNVTELIDCVDLDNSDVSYYPNDSTRVVNIMQFAFHKDRIKDVPIFKIPQDTGVIFVRRSFINTVLQNKLTGVGVEDPSKISYMRSYVSAVKGLPM